MSVYLTFTFDNRKYHFIDISNTTCIEINNTLWTLLHILKAKEVTFKQEEDTIK